MSGVLVWLGASQTILISTQVSGTVAISIPVSQTVGTIIAVSGITAVSAVSTIVTILGTQIVSIAQTSVSVAALPTVNTIITILGTQVVTVVPGLSVTIQQGASVTGTVLALEAGNTNIALIVTSTLVAAGGSTVLMTVYQGATQTTAGAAFWVIPAGKNFRVNAMQAVIQNSITTTPVNARVFLMQSTAALTFTSATPIVAMVAQGIATTDVQVQAALAGLNMAVTAANTVGIGITFNTTGNIVMIAVVGYLY
jgi:hypothetical protein